MSSSRNIILKLHGFQEWICCTEGKYHLTGERSNARPMDEDEKKEVIEAWRHKYSIALVEQPWIILNAKNTPYGGE